MANNTSFSQANWNTTSAGATIFVASTLSALSQSLSIAGQATAVGGIAVFSDGTDSIVMINGQAAAAAGLVSNFSFRIDNFDMVTTTQVGQVTNTASNFAFSVAGSATTGGDATLNITLS